MRFTGRPYARVGAVLAHLRARVLYNLAFALVFLLLAVVSAVHFGWTPPCTSG
ncbi:hypothetical protein ACFV1L_24470 [Kitasatospora sp. NPDC059646]|uniref:hypothetical protein n=1 Tax=Kitasatospora sp. NPDC059646 TaxID=3346893 RepID=UPI0036BD167A